MMTRKHFEATAEIVARISNPTTRETVAVGFALLFRTDNPRFDELTFLTACGVA